MVDFDVVIDASDLGRIRSVNILNELYMRMAQAAPIQAAPVLKQLPDVERVQTVPGIDLAWEAQVPFRQAPPQNPTPMTAYESDNRATASPEDVETSLHRVTPRRKWSSPFKNASAKSSEDVVPAEVEPTKGKPRRPRSQVSDLPLGIFFEGNEDASKEPPSKPPRRRPESTQEQTLSTSWKPSPVMPIDEDNPWQSEVSASSQQDAGSHHHIHEQSQGTRRASTGLTLVNDARAHASKAGLSLMASSPIMHSHARPKSINSVGSGSSTPDVIAPQRKFSGFFRRRTSSEASGEGEKRSSIHEVLQTPPPVSRNPSSQQSITAVSKGFCKGAYKLQVGLVKESLKISNQSAAMTGQFSRWICASSKCAFEGGACRVGKAWEFDNAIRTHQGVRYRWTFLVKSHIAMSRVKNHMFDYQCIFCTEQGEERAIYRGDRAYIEHVATHRGQPKSKLDSERVTCMVGRVGRDHEVFDVNFAPIEGGNESQDRTLVNTASMNSPVVSGNRLAPALRDEPDPEWVLPEPMMSPSPWN